MRINRAGGLALLAAAPMMATGCASHPDAEQVAMAPVEADALPDSRGTGPYRALKEVPATLPGHTLYRPADLATPGTPRLGVLIWGNGGCSADGASARQHLLQIASHGYVAIAPGTIRSGPGAPAPDRARNIGADGGLPPVETTPADLLAGLDWILAENARPGSPYHNRIDPAAIAVGGHSCGGLQAIKLSADPRIAATLVQNSGVLDPAIPNPIRGLTVEKAELARLHAPTLYILGGQSDMAYPNGADDYARINHVPVAFASIDVGHGGTFAQPNGGAAAKVAVDWLNWHLRGDRRAAATFTGTDSALCTSAEWTFSSKGLP